MKILLIHPPTPSIIAEVLGAKGPPLGLAYLASVVREEGHDVTILDALAEEISLVDVARRVRWYDPDVVGITATTPMIYDAYAIARLAKVVNPNVKVIIGGPHVTFTPIQTLRECPYIDIIVMGEGEMTFKELIKTLSRSGDLKDVRGIAFRHNSELKVNPPRPPIGNIDDIPVPAYDLLPLHKYLVGEKRYGAVITSRGCPYRCIFCSSSLQFGKRWRAHSPKRVLEELRLLREKYRIREVEFLDDTFTLDRRRSLEVARGIREEGIDISWTFSSRANTFDSELGAVLRKAGAWLVYIGLESGSSRILRYIRKGITLSQSRDAVRAAKKSGLKVLGSFVIGFPPERGEDIKLTISFAKSLNMDYVQFTIATPFPGTELWEIANRDRLLTTRDWRMYTTLNAVMRGYFLSEKEIQHYLETAYITFYLSLGRIKKDLLENRGFLLRKAIKSLLKIAALKLA